MTERRFAVSNDLQERPEVMRVCPRCHVRWEDVDTVEVVVTRRGVAHFPTDWGDTKCGLDATGKGWWWPV